MVDYLEALKTAEFITVVLFFLLSNVLMFLVSVASCLILWQVYRDKRIFDKWQELCRIEILSTFSSIAINVAISVLGWWFWTQGFITIDPVISWYSVVDVIIMVLVIDFLMYVFHRIAHHPLIYNSVHSFHHRHNVTNPISLFVLHPVEVIGFGGMMIGFLMIYPISLIGLLCFLGLNLLFGTLGHSGVEPIPKRLLKKSLLNLVGTSTFHAKHHECIKYNYGFYTTIWDQLLGTSSPLKNI